MTPEPTTHRFAGGSVVNCWPSQRYLETHFPDGAICPAKAGDSAEDLARARSLGYGSESDPTLRMTVEHETAHTLLAEYFGEPYSETLMAVARGRTVPSDVVDDESIVLALQRLGRDGTFDPVLWTLGEVDAAGLAVNVRRIADGLLASVEN